MTNHLVHLAATARHLPMIERDSVHEAEVRAMKRSRPKYWPTVARAPRPRIMLRKARLDDV
jgi:hypothetical protein